MSPCPSIHTYNSCPPAPSTHTRPELELFGQPSMHIPAGAPSPHSPQPLHPSQRAPAPFQPAEPPCLTPLALSHPSPQVFQGHPSLCIPTLYFLSLPLPLVRPPAANLLRDHRLLHLLPRPHPFSKQHLRLRTPRDLSPHLSLDSSPVPLIRPLSPAFFHKTQPVSAAARPRPSTPVAPTALFPNPARPAHRRCQRSRCSPLFFQVPPHLKTVWRRRPYSCRQCSILLTPCSCEVGPAAHAALPLAAQCTCPPLGAGCAPSSKHTHEIAT